MDFTDDLVKKQQEEWEAEKRSLGIEPEQFEMEAGLNQEGYTLAHSIPVEETAITLRPGEDLEVHSFYTEAVKMLEYANAKVIENLTDSKLATDDLVSIGTLRRAMEAKRKEKLAPFDEQLKAIRETYNELMAPILEAETITKRKQIVFLNEQKRIQQEQEEINRKRMEAAQQEAALNNGVISEPVNLVEVQEAPERVRATAGMSGLTNHWVYEVIDFSLLPDEYKVEDAAMLNAIAKKHHDQKQVQGVRFFNKPFLTTRR